MYNFHNTHTHTHPHTHTHTISLSFSLFEYVCVCVCTLLFPHLCLVAPYYLSLSLSHSLSLSLSLSLYLSVYQSIYLSVSLIYSWLSRYILQVVERYWRGSRSRDCSMVPFQWVENERSLVKLIGVVKVVTKLVTGCQWTKNFHVKMWDFCLYISWCSFLSFFLFLSTIPCNDIIACYQCKSYLDLSKICERPFSREWIIVST